ncbi:MAG: T9SS type A sorting domain-containing protein [bacterium]
MKTKMILILVLAILIVVAGKTNAQDLKMTKHLILGSVKDNPTYFMYNEVANKLYFGDNYIFKIYDISTEKMELSEDAYVDLRVSPNHYLRRNGNEIKKIDPFTNQELFAFSFPEFKTILWNISEDGNHLILLTEKLGIHWYKECELIVYSTLTNDIEKQMSYKLDLPDKIYETDYNFAMDIKISSNGKFALINWERRVDYLKPFESGTMGLDIISLETEQLIKRLNGKRSICFSTTSDTLLISNWYWGNKDNISTFYYDSSNFVKTQTCETLYNGKKIFTENSNHIIGNYLFTTNDKKLYRVNLVDLICKRIQSEYKISKFVICKNLLIAQDIILENRFTFYDISNAISVNDPKNEKVLYPNPANDFLNLNVDYNSLYNVQVIDEIGKVIDTLTFTNSYQLNYDTSRLPKGMYILQLNSKSFSKSYKFLKE